MVLYVVVRVGYLCGCCLFFINKIILPYLTVLFKLKINKVTPTFEEGKRLEESRCHKRISKTEKKATEKQPSGGDVNGVRSGTHKTHCHLPERGFMSKDS